MYAMMTPSREIQCESMRGPMPLTDTGMIASITTTADAPTGPLKLWAVMGLFGR